MDEHVTPLIVEVDPSKNLNDLLAERIATSGSEPLIDYRTSDDGPWTSLSAAEFDQLVVAVAKGLIAHGVQAGQSVGIMSRTRYEWSLLDWAIWAAGAVTVPLYETSSSKQVKWICEDSDVVLVVTETAEHTATVDKVKSKLPQLREVLTLDDGAIDALVTAGADVEDDAVARRRDIASLDDIATIIYTSGTTGRPKGVELTHGNFYVLAVNAVADLNVVVSEPGARTLLFMPLAHVFARFIHVLIVPAGAVLGHTPDPKTLLADLATFKPTFILSVPRVFEKVYNGSEQKAAAGGKIKIFHAAVRVAIAYSRSLDTPSGPGFGLKLKYKLFDKLVLHKLRAALGGKAQWAISGGAPLGERLGHFFRGVGLTVLEGYGLTETTAPATVNRPETVSIGTVGHPLPGTSVRIDSDGEILLKGIHIFKGYHNNPEATAEAFDGDWFRSGDLGSLDENGALRITGRKKEIIVTAGGKNVAPAVLEDRLRSHPLVSQVVVVGDQRNFIAALVTLDVEALPGWLSTHGVEELTVEQAAEHPAVREALDKAVDRANKAVSRAESIRKYSVLATDFTIENDYLTPSMKVKRSAVLTDFADEIDKLYEGGSNGPAE